MNYQSLKNVEPPINAQIILFNSRNRKFIFAIRKKVDGKDCLFVSQTYPADQETAFRYGLKKFILLNGHATYWACLHCPL